MINDNLVVSDNATSILEISPFDENGDCYFILKNPAEGDDSHIIDVTKAKEIISFLQQSILTLKH